MGRFRRAVCRCAGGPGRRWATAGATMSACGHNAMYCCFAARPFSVRSQNLQYFCVPIGRCVFFVPAGLMGFARAGFSLLESMQPVQGSCSDALRILQFMHGFCSASKKGECLGSRANFCRFVSNVSAPVLVLDADCCKNVLGGG